MTEQSLKITGISICNRLTAVMLVAILVVGSLTAGTWLNLRHSDPLNSSALETLITRLTENPTDNALRNEIRALDLLARRAYITARWQVETGTIILCAALAVLIGALAVKQHLLRKPPDPRSCDSPPPESARQQSARTGLAVIGIGAGTVALAAAALLHRELTWSYSHSPATTVRRPAKAEKAPPGTTWPHFRGPGGNGVASVSDVPAGWDGLSGKGILWKSSIPAKGFSSPVVWSDRIYLTGGDKESREIYCFAATDGSLAWRYAVNDLPQPSMTLPDAEETGFAAPTATVDANGVCAIFATGHVICLDHAGMKIWEVSLGVPDNHYGHSSSLIAGHGLVFVQFDHNEGARVIALDRADGSTRWESIRGAISWSSPILVNTGTRDELILTSSSTVDSYDPLTGAELWTIDDCLEGEVGASAAFSDGMVFVANEYAVGAGIIIEPDNPETPASVVWRYEDNLPSTASPVAAGGRMIMASGYGVLSCLDAGNGNLFWEHEFDEGFYASPLIINDTIYALDLEGVMHVVACDTVFTEIDSRPIGEATSATPAFVNGRIYLRGEKHLFCIGDPGASRE